jgi:hypothetical protein
MEMMLRFIGKPPFRVGQAIATPPGWSNPPRQEQHHDDDQQDANHTYAAMAEAISIASETAAEAAKKEDNEYDDKYCSK